MTSWWEFGRKAEYILFEYIFWIPNHFHMQLCQLIVMGNILRGNFARFEDWFLKLNPFYLMKRFFQWMKNQWWWACNFLLFWGCTLRPSKIVNIINWKLTGCIILVYCSFIKIMKILELISIHHNWVKNVTHF